MKSHSVADFISATLSMTYHNVHAMTLRWNSEIGKKYLRTTNTTSKTNKYN